MLCVDWAGTVAYSVAFEPTQAAPSHPSRRKGGGQGWGASNRSPESETNLAQGVTGVPDSRRFCASWGG